MKTNIFNKINFRILFAQSSPTLCHPMDCSLSGSSVHGIFQARVLEWIAISFSGGGSPALQADALPSEPPGNPLESFSLFKTTLPMYPCVLLKIYMTLLKREI